MSETISIFERKRQRLSRDVIEAAVQLLQHMNGAAGFCLPIPNTDPPLYVVCGSGDAIDALLGPEMKTAGNPQGDAGRIG